MIATLRSLPDPHALRTHLQERYDLPFTGCTLIRSLVNDVYELTAADRRYVLKLYRTAGWHPAEIRWEVELSAHLATSGLAVPRVQPLLDGALVGVLDAAEGARPFTLSTFVVGAKPRPPFDDELYRSFGHLVASFHDAADNFAPVDRRRPSDLRRRLDEPLAQVLPLVSPDDRELLSSLANAVRKKLDEYGEQGLNWGVCHGDVTLDNVLLTSDGLALHDFDLSAEGWRAADLTGVAATPHWDAFTAGYTSTRILKDVDLAAIPWLAVVGDIFNLRFHLYDKPHLRGTESLTESWASGTLDALRSAASRLL